MIWICDNVGPAMMQRSYHFAGQHFANVGIYHVNNVWPAMMQRSYRVAGTHSANLGFHHFPRQQQQQHSCGGGPGCAGQSGEGC